MSLRSAPADPDAASPEFELALFDETCEFVDEIRLSEKLAGYPARDYWVRVCLIDLLNFQHPFSTPKRFALRR